MKYFLLIVVVMTSKTAYSVPPLDLYGYNEKGEFITVIGESEGEMYSEISINKNGKYVLLKNQDCKFSGGVFTCAREGESPLAGISYQAIHPSDAAFPHTIDCGAILSCVRGCNPNAPIELMESGYECYDEATCPNVGSDNGMPYLISRKGVINSESVNLRLNAHSQSKILDTLNKGVRVNVIDSNYVCTKVNDKIGMWVYLRTESDTEKNKEGWVYDHYITYQKQSH